MGSRFVSPSDGDDSPGLGPLLLRAGAKQKCARHDHAQRDYFMCRDPGLDPVGVQSRIWAGQGWNRRWA